MGIRGYWGGHLGGLEPRLLTAPIPSGVLGQSAVLGSKKFSLREY